MTRLEFHIMGPDNKAADFDKALLERDRQHYVLCLYVAGMTARSLESIVSIKKICEEHLSGRYEIEVVDIYLHPELAKDQQVLAAPTLIKSLPLPLRKFIGRLTDEDRVLKALELRPKD